MFLRIDLYSYEYMDDWEMSNEKLLAEKEGFYGHLNMEGITDVDYTHRKRVWKDLKKKKKIGECHDLCVRSDTLLPADVFNNFRNVPWNM